MKKGSTFTYLHSGHLGDTALQTNTSGNMVTNQGYYAFGKKRIGGTLSTDHNFTGQKIDGSGLLYYNARYYDPQIGQFVSPDTVVPEPTNLFDYNRYMYVRGNSLKYNDPTGHCIFGLDTIVCLIAAATVAGGASNAAGNAGVQIYQNWNSDRDLTDNLSDFNKTEVGIAFGYGAVVVDLHR